MKRKTIWKALFAAVLLVVLSAVALIMPSAAEANSLDVAYCNLSFENEVHILYAIESNDPNVQLLVWNGTQDSYTTDTPHDTAEVVARNYNINGVSHTVFSYDGLAAKQMSDMVYARAYNPTTGEYGALDKYSILQYAYNMLGKTGDNPSTNEGLKAMLTQMLEYGATAQTYFGYKTDRLANADWVQIQVMGGTLEDGFSCGLYLAGDEVTLTAPATDEDGAPFVQWQDESGAVLTKDRSHLLTVGNTNTAYTAFYAYCIHKEVIDPAVPATCTETGLTEGKHCSECGEVLVAQTAIPATGKHTYNADGLCTVCGEEIKPTEGLLYTLNDDGLCYSVSGIGSATATDILIPAVHGGLPVTSIGFRAFSGCDNLTSITIPDSVTSIGQEAFFGCRNLSSITIPDSVTTIGWRAFDYCTNLIQEDGGILYVDTWAIAWDGFTATVTLREGTKGIVSGAFDTYTDLTSISITIPGSMTSIGDSAFLGCTRLTRVTMGTGVTYIESSAFNRCTSLTSITIPYSVTRISEAAFKDCTSLTHITIPHRVDYLGRWVFSGCSRLESVTIINASDDRVHFSIFENLFFECNSLKTITIPDGVIGIDESAFEGCTGLTTITIPHSVRSIGDSAFYNCTSLTRITFQGTKAQWEAINKGKNWDSQSPSFTIDCTDGTITKS